MIYFAVWYEHGDGTWGSAHPFPDDYEFMSLIYYLRDNPKLFMRFEEGNC